MKKRTDWGRKGNSMNWYSNWKLMTSKSIPGKLISLAAVRFRFVMFGYFFFFFFFFYMEGQKCQSLKVARWSRWADAELESANHSGS